MLRSSAITSANEMLSGALLFISSRNLFWAWLKSSMVTGQIGDLKYEKIDLNQNRPGWVFK